MLFENSSYSKTIKYTKLEMPFGNYYLCDKFLIGELHEGVHFDSEGAEVVIDYLIDFYGVDAKIGYISNRINDYSNDPVNWIKVEKECHLIVVNAIVMYNNSTYMNASIEKLFSKNSIKRCMSLKEAIDWMENLDEFN